MSDAIGKIGSSIGGAFTKSPLGFIGTGIGAVSNFLKSRQQNKYLQDQINYQKFLRSLSTDPAKMAQYISGFEKPLSKGLTSAVGNEAQAFGAERGLSTSPQIMAEIESQALAPYQMQEQQQAINAAMSSLGMPAGTPQFPSDGGQTDLTSLIKMLLGGKQDVNTLDNIKMPATLAPEAASIGAATSAPEVPQPSGEVPSDFNFDDLMMQFAGG